MLPKVGTPIPILKYGQFWVFAAVLAASSEFYRSYGAPLARFGLFPESVICLVT